MPDDAIGMPGTADRGLLRFLTCGSVDDGASTADLAVLLVDARKGVLTQTRRHSLVCSLLGVRHVVLAINKLDLVGYNRAVFERIAEDYGAFAANLSFASLMMVPLSAREG